MWQSDAWLYNTHDCSEREIYQRKLACAREILNFVELNTYNTKGSHADSSKDTTGCSEKKDDADHVHVMLRKIASKGEEEESRVQRQSQVQGFRLDTQAYTGFSPLMLAAYQGRLEYLELFMQYSSSVCTKVDIELKDHNHDTCVTLAAKRGH